MTLDTETSPLRIAAAPAKAEPCDVGPFAPPHPQDSVAGLLGTGLLVMYPVVATVVIVISGVMLAGSALVA